MASSQKRDGPTPNGGAYSQAFFLDVRQVLVDERVATRIRIIEYNDKGEIIHTTYGTIDRQAK
jgi:hypothetical protein